MAVYLQKAESLFTLLAVAFIFPNHSHRQEREMIDPEHLQFPTIPLLASIHSYLVLF